MIVIIIKSFIPPAKVVLMMGSLEVLFVTKFCCLECSCCLQIPTLQPLSTGLDKISNSNKNNTYCCFNSNSLVHDFFLIYLYSAAVVFSLPSLVCDSGRETEGKQCLNPTHMNI